MLVSGIDLAVLFALFVAAALVIRELFSRNKQRTRNIELVLPPLVFFFAFFALPTGAYLIHQQPIIFPRYGLILFGLGLPVLACAYFAIKQRRPDLSRRILIAIIVLCTLNWSAQFVGAIGELNRYSAQRRIADYLRAQLDPKSNTKIFCDEGTVRALSGIRDDRFVISSEVPKDYDGFYAALAEKKVDWLVVATQPGSTPARLFPWSEYGEHIGPYETVTQANSEFLHTNIHVYRRIQ